MAMFGNIAMIAFKDYFSVDDFLRREKTTVDTVKYAHFREYKHYPESNGSGKGSSHSRVSHIKKRIASSLSIFRGTPHHFETRILIPVFIGTAAFKLEGSETMNVEPPAFHPATSFEDATLYLLSVSTPLVFKLVYPRLHSALCKRSSRFKDLSLSKQEKILKTFLKGCVYTVLFFSLLSTNCSTLKYWLSGSDLSKFAVEQPYARHFLALVPGYYTFELLTTSHVNFSVWLHHCLVIIPLSLISNLTLLQPADANFIVKFSAIVGFNSASNFPIYFLYASTIPLAACKKKYLVLYWRCFQLSFSHLLLQMIIWPFYFQHVKETGIVSMLFMIIWMGGQFIANLFNGLNMLHGAGAVRKLANLEKYE